MHVAGAAGEDLLRLLRGIENEPNVGGLLAATVV